MKSRIASGIFGIVLGSLGIHKFYLGYWFWGIVYLLLSWTCLPGIIGFIEGVTYLVMTDKDFDIRHNSGYHYEYDKYGRRIIE